MVFFTCNHCGESVKKPAVEKHYSFKCHGAPVNVSCMDCLKDFHGEEYVAHTKCITEAEKYSGKDFVAKDSKNSGAKKQESWMDIIRSILDTEEYKLSASARSAFQRLQTFDNVPRKKAKFQNFVANCMRMPRGQAEEVWTVLAKELDKMKLAKQMETAAAKAMQATEASAVETNGKDAVNTQENGVKLKHKKAKKAAKRELVEINGKEENEVKSKDKKAKKAAKRELTESNGAEEPVSKKSKKQKSETVSAAVEHKPVVEPASAVAENDSDEQQEFAWSAMLKKIVDKHAEGIALEKLKKKLLKKYTAKLGLNEALTEKQQKKFEKKFTKNLKKCTELQLADNMVQCC